MSIKHTAEKYAPEFLVGFGIASVVIGTAKLCKSSKQADEVIEETSHELKEIHENPNSANYKKDLSLAYFRFVRGILKTYGPGAAIEGIGLVCLVLSNGIYKDRAITFSAAYTAVNEMYNQYRKRVVDKYGEEADHDILYNVTEETVKEEYIDEEGKKRKRSKKVKKVNGPVLSPVSRVFGHNSRLYEPGDMDFNLYQLKDIQDTFNNLLRIEKVIYLDRVLRELDLLYCEDDDEMVKRLHIMGWIWDPNGPDDQIDFGIKNKYPTGGFVNGDATNGLEEDIWLEFNCQADVWSD